ncbi:MAG: hypothetical protein AB1405_00220 [Bdellovibrionota bacterium]
MNTKMKFTAIASSLLLAAVLVGCPGKARQKESAMDTPEHHTKVGERLMAEEKWDEATREFELAIQLDPKFAAAYVGRGLVKAAKKEWKGAQEDLEKALDVAKSKGDKAAAHTGMVRLLTEQRPDKDWIEDAEDHYEQAIDLDAKYSAAYYYFGVAQKKAFNFEKAGDLFKKVLDLNTDFVPEATREWRLVQDIQLAAPGSEIGKQIALIDKLTRADAAALFIEELNLSKLYKVRGKKQFDTSFKAPDAQTKMQTETMVKMAEATDIANHVLKADIDEALKIGIRGLEAYPDHTFKADETVAKAEYAVMIEDILIKITGDQDLATKFIGDTSPFPDVRNDAPYFNAIMVCSSRQILGAKDLSTGEFGAKDPITGASALLAIRKLKEALQI